MTDSEDEILLDAAPAGVGPMLRAAREAKGLTLEQVASETRIARRHLEHIESGELEALPGRTYAIGFARTYARTVGLDQEEVASLAREEMDTAAINARYEQQARGTFEPGDPSRAPGGRLLYFSLFAILILLVGIFFAARALFAPAAEMPSLVEEQAREEAQAAVEQEAAQEQMAAVADPTGPVVFTAEGEAWVRFYDGEGTVLQEGTMAEGESFTVPADAVNPQIITGRPDRLAITVGGQPVRKLASGVETIQDVPISAAALLARTGGGAPTIGFALGTAAAPAVEPATTPEPLRTPVTTPGPTSQPSPAPPVRPTPTPTATAVPAPAQEAPEPAATAPPQAQPAAPAESDAAPEAD
jgi:cytoskeletal protein RodZ